LEKTVFTSLGAIAVRDFVIESLGPLEKMRCVGFLAGKDAMRQGYGADVVGADWAAIFLIIRDQSSRGLCRSLCKLLIY
jgi:hypothetical protein